MEKWEIEFVNNPYFYNRRLVIMITGLSFEEVTKVAGQKDSWYGRDYKRVFRELGFNCSDRFQKFDADTPTPCIMRSTKTVKKKVYWYASVYYDGIIYIPGHGKHTIEEYNLKWTDEKITSMLRVWI